MDKKELAKAIIYAIAMSSRLFKDDDEPYPSSAVLDEVAEATDKRNMDAVRSSGLSKTEIRELLDEVSAEYKCSKEEHEVLIKRLSCVL